MKKLTVTLAALIACMAMSAPTSHAAAKQTYVIQNGRIVLSSVLSNSYCSTGNAAISAPSCSKCGKTTCPAAKNGCVYLCTSSGSGSTGTPTATVKPTATPKPAASATVKPTATPAPSGTAVASALETKMLTLINQERANNGLSALKMDAALVNLARIKSQDMVTNNYFAHNSPTYGSASNMVKNAGISASAVGENIAHHGSMEKAHAALMSSSGHRANILGKSYNNVGIGIVSDRSGYPMITQIFIRK